MDWIEQWFNVSPDHGDGSLEMLVFVTLISVALCLLVSTRAPLRARLRSMLRRAGVMAARSLRRSP